MGEEDRLIIAAIRWTLDCVRAVEQAGGLPKYIIDSLPDDLKVALVRNNLRITFTKGEEK